MNKDSGGNNRQRRQKKSRTQSMLDEDATYQKKSIYGEKKKAKHSMSPPEYLNESNTSKGYHNRNKSKGRGGHPLA